MLHLALPIIALPMQEGLCIAVQTGGWIVSHHTLLIITQCDKKGSLLNAVQRLFIHSTTEELLPGLSPRDSVKMKN